MGSFIYIIVFGSTSAPSQTGSSALENIPSIPAKNYPT